MSFTLDDIQRALRSAIYMYPRQKLYIETTKLGRDYIATKVCRLGPAMDAKIFVLNAEVVVVPWVVDSGFMVRAANACSTCGQSLP